MHIRFGMKRKDKYLVIRVSNQMPVAIFRSLRRASLHAMVLCRQEGAQFTVKVSR